jgi:hypothetical protein
MERGPRAFVESWLRRREGAASADLLASEALEAVWLRARRSLSEPALQALSRNALDAAARIRPLLADLRLTPRGFELGACAGAPRDELLAALGELLVELLSLVEDTSGAILAPALQAELLRVAGVRRTPPSGVRPVAPG